MVGRCSQTLGLAPLQGMWHWEGFGLGSPPHSPYLQDVTGPLFPWQRRWHPNTSHTSLAVARVTRSLQGGQV